MNRLDHQLNRLFKAAAHVRRQLPSGAPFAVECPLLAQWRSGAGPGAGEDLFLLLPIVRRAFVLACVLALIALAINYRGLTQRTSDEAVIINSPVSLTYLP